MRKHLTIVTFTLFMLSNSCTVPEYFHDEASAKRQKELKSSRGGNIAGDIFSIFGTAFADAVFNTETNWDPSEKEFKKINLINPSSDTIYVNMLTDVYWDKEDYCDFMDIRIPPKTNCKVLVPVHAEYNLYFSNTPQNNDDELIQIYTDDIKKISLYSGLTFMADTISIK